jgi:hypothetical protein
MLMPSWFCFYPTLVCIFESRSEFGSDSAMIPIGLYTIRTLRYGIWTFQRLYMTVRTDRHLMLVRL